MRSGMEGSDAIVARLGSVSASGSSCWTRLQKNGTIAHNPVIKTHPTTFGLKSMFPSRVITRFLAQLTVNSLPQQTLRFNQRVLWHSVGQRLDSRTRVRPTEREIFWGMRSMRAVDSRNGVERPTRLRRTPKIADNDGSPCIVVIEGRLS